MNERKRKRIECRTCPIREQTGDGAFVGRCDFGLNDGYRCPRHGDVSPEIATFIRTGKTTPENELRRRLGKPLLGAKKMNEQLDLAERKIAVSTKATRLPLPAEMILELIDEVERLRATHDDYARGLEITAQILTTLGRDPLPTLAGRLNQIIALVAFKEPK